MIPLVLALLYGNCPLTFKLNHILPFSRGCHHWRCSVERGVLGGFAGFVGRVPMLRSLFNKAASLRACGFVEGRLQHGCFSSVVCETFESTFFDEHLATTASNSLNFDILLG